MNVLDKTLLFLTNLKTSKMKKMINKLIKKNTLVVWLLNQKKVCTMILSFCWILTLFIPVLSDNTTFVSVNLIDPDFHSPSSISRKNKKIKAKKINRKEKNIKTMTKICSLLIHLQRKNVQKINGDSYPNLLIQS